MITSRRTVDLIVVGAGAAGLATAIFAARSAPPLAVVCLDGARRVGAKILVSGGARCNVTNRIVTEQDFWGGSSRTVKRVLRAFPAADATRFFESLGVALHEEEDGKLFPDTNSARTVLDALLAEVDRLGIGIDTRARVTDVARREHTFEVHAAEAVYAARAVALATGGRSLPKSGSDGFGYQLAMRCGHRCVDTTPALAPLLLGNGPHAQLSGVAHPAALSVRLDGRLAVRLTGAMLWTHFGASGPVVLNASRHWHRGILEGHAVGVTLNVMPEHTFESADAWLQRMALERPRASPRSVLASALPTAVADTWVAAAGLASGVTLAHLSREERRRLSRLLVETELDVQGSRGYGHAEVTAGGIPLEEIDPATMESRMCEGLYLVGEILDVDGRLGGFNFQWAWSSGYVAGRAIAAQFGETVGRT